MTGSIINTVVFILYGTRKSTVDLTTNLWMKVAVRLRLLVQPSILLYTATFLGDTLKQSRYLLLSLLIPTWTHAFESITSELHQASAQLSLTFSDVGSEITRELINSTSPVLRRFSQFLPSPRGYFSSQQIIMEGKSVHVHSKPFE